VQRRKQFVKLVEDVKAYGGEVLIFSSMHESGQRESFCWGLSFSASPSSLGARPSWSLTLLFPSSSSSSSSPLSNSPGQ
jgi:hypothetical protein